MSYKATNVILRLGNINASEGLFLFFYMLNECNIYFKINFLSLLNKNKKDIYFLISSKNDVFFIRLCLYNANFKYFYVIYSIYV